MRHTIIATILVMIVLYVKPTDLLVVSISIGIFVFMLIAQEISDHSEKVIKQKEKASRELHQTLSAVGLDLVAAIRQLNKEK